jgi:4-hydroxybenzoate polyprenyltransferase
MAGLGPLFWLGLAAALIQLLLQAVWVATDDPLNCLAKFRSNRWIGWLVFAGITAGHLV